MYLYTRFPFPQWIRRSRRTVRPATPDLLIILSRQGVATHLRHVPPDAEAGVGHHDGLLINPRLG